MAIEVTSGNPTLIQEQVSSLLVQPLEQASTFLAAGPTVIDSSSPVRIPRIASGVTAGFVAEGSQISDGDVSFDEVEMLPSSMKGLKVLVKLSNELIRTSVVGLESVLRTRLVADVANALDAALWNGAGTSDTIKGIFKASGIQTGDLDLTDPDSLIDALAVAQGNHVNPSHWVMTPASFAAIRKVKVGTTDKRYVIDPSTMQDATQPRLFGVPVILSTTAIGANQVGLVDFSKVVVARDVNAEVKILDQTFGDFDSVGIRVVSRWDVALLQDKAVTLLTDGS
ncbi:capsid protein [Mycolicibacterium fortuitum]|uniref:phage major capsid protein n=1 Tax=Mycolicibacterium fortuitum TaxID=1766 RepID=UPI0007ED3580|nr:phage major capsid protein [Mycolicibacterium fortuitum]OBK01714.1 capsid protein [Mycolicibacterium fortuitum]